MTEAQVTWMSSCPYKVLATYAVDYVGHRGIIRYSMHPMIHSSLVYHDEAKMHEILIDTVPGAVEAFKSVLRLTGKIK